MRTNTVHPMKIKRITRGLTQWELSQISGVSQTKLSLIETGQLTRIDDGIKGRIARILGESVENLFRPDRNPTPAKVVDE